MKINLTHKLVSIDGVELKDKDNKPLLLKTILINVLLEPSQSKDITGENKLKRYNLASDIQAASLASGKYIVLSIDDTKLLKDLVGKLYPPLIVGQVWNVLEKGSE